MAALSRDIWTKEKIEYIAGLWEEKPLLYNTALKEYYDEAAPCTSRFLSHSRTQIVRFLRLLFRFFTINLIIIYANAATTARLSAILQT